MNVKIDHQSSKLLMQAVKKAVEDTVGKDFNLSVNLKGGTIDPGSSLVVRVELRPRNSDGSAKYEFEDDFRKHCSQFGLKPEHLFAEITYARERYKIIGLNLNRYKMPLNVERLRDKKKYFVPINAADALRDKEFIKRDGGCFLDRETFEAKPEMIPIHSCIGDGCKFCAQHNRRGRGMTRDEAIRKAEELQSNGPENYYMDGELKAQGYSEKKIREYWISRFMREGATAA